MTFIHHISDETGRYVGMLTIWSDKALLANPLFAVCISRGEANNALRLARRQNATIETHRYSH